MSEEIKVLDEEGAILLTSNIKTLADATYPANAAVASPYNSSISYIVGSYCLHNGLLYKCNTDIPVGGEVWTAAHWTQVNLGNELALDRKMQFTSVVVDKTSFVQDTTYEDFPFRAAVALTGVTASMYPEVVFDTVDAVSGLFAPTVLSYNGGVYIYANGQPDTNVTIPSIVCWIRGVALDSSGSLNIADEIQAIEDNIDSIEGDIEDIQSDILNIQDVQNSALKINLLWENAEPMSTFAAQTLSINLNAYQFLWIGFKWYTGDSSTPTIFQIFKVNEIGRAFRVEVGAYINMRTLTITTASVEFSACSQSTGTGSTSTVNDALVPTQIYGLKGVITQ